jgi:hypothetical protein
VTKPLDVRRNLAAILLVRVEEYMRTYELPAAFLSQKAARNANFIADMRSGCVPILASIDKVNDFLDANPNGISYRRPTLPKQPDNVVKFFGDARNKIDPSTMVVSRDPCFRCGVRGDLGCRHQPKGEPILLREMVG